MGEMRLEKQKDFFLLVAQNLVISNKNNLDQSQTVTHDTYNQG